MFGQQFKMDANYDYNAAFKSISLKLKKRFLRKPNVLDAIDEYTSLSKQLENEECHSLAGYCMQVRFPRLFYIANK